MTFINITLDYEKLIDFCIQFSVYCYAVIFGPKIKRKLSSAFCTPTKLCLYNNIVAIVILTNFVYSNFVKLLFDYEFESTLPVKDLDN